MAVLRERRIPLLTLQLPSSDSASETPGDSRCRSLLPPIHPPASTTSTSEYRLSDFEKIGVLGHGNGGNVYKVRHRRTAAVYALKLLHTDHRHSREAEILRRTDSPFVVRCHAAFQTPSGDSALLLDLADAGSLDDLLRHRGRRPVPEPALAEIARQSLLGLAYLHSHQIVHRDIKPSNLLVTAAGEVKIADFGVGKIVRRMLDPCLSYVGTCAYMSPERFDPGSHGGEYNAYAADVWSLGLTLMELRLGHFPLLPAGERPDWAALMWAICFGDPPACPSRRRTSSGISSGAFYKRSQGSGGRWRS